VSDEPDKPDPFSGDKIILGLLLAVLGIIVGCGIVMFAFEKLLGSAWWH
jgi:hypothetical protein